jgi:hypothetical protein
MERFSELDAFSVAEFCQRHGICRAGYYNLRREGLAPKSFKVGRRRLISKESAAEWRSKMEAASAEGA